MTKKINVLLDEEMAELQLIFAAATGNVALLKELIKAGVNPRTHDELALKLVRIGGHEKAASNLHKAIVSKRIEDGEKVPRP